MPFPSQSAFSNRQRLDRGVARRAPTMGVLPDRANQAAALARQVSNKTTRGDVPITAVADIAAKHANIAGKIQEKIRAVGAKAVDIKPLKAPEVVGIKKKVMPHY